MSDKHEGAEREAAEREIFFTDEEETRAIFGIEDRYLKAIKSTFGVSIVARHDGVKIAARRRPSRARRRRFSSCGGCTPPGRPITLRDVETIAEAIQNEGAFDEKGERIEIFAAAGIRAGRRRRGRRRTCRRCGSTTSSSPSAPRGRARPTSRSQWRSARSRSARSGGSSSCGRRSRRARNWGFCPGDIQAKVNPYLRPLYDALHDMMEYGQLRRYMESDIIEVVPLAYMRGRTLNDSIIILDEAQNCTASQMKMFLTRLGMRSRSIVTGDVSQIDLPAGERSGLREAEKILKEHPRHIVHVPVAAATSYATNWCSA